MLRKRYISYTLRDPDPIPYPTLLPSEVSLQRLWDYKDLVLDPSHCVLLFVRPDLVYSGLHRETMGHAALSPAILCFWKGIGWISSRLS